MGATSSPEHMKPAYVIAAPDSAGRQEVCSPYHRKDREEDRGDRPVHCLRRLELCCRCPDSIGIGVSVGGLSLMSLDLRQA